MKLEDEILLYLGKCGPSQRDTMCERLRIPRTTMFEHLNDLLFDGLVEKIRAIPTGKPGRPKEYWRLVK